MRRYFQGNILTSTPPKFEIRFYFSTHAVFFLIRGGKMIGGGQILSTVHVIVSEPDPSCERVGHHLTSETMHVTEFMTLIHRWRAENQSGLTQNQVYWKLHELHKNGVKNMQWVWAYDWKFQILEISAAPETHFNSILKFRGASSMFVG